MAHQDVPNVAQLVGKYTQAGEAVENVFHVARTTGAWTKDDLVALAELFEGWETVTAAPLRTNNVQLNEVTATDLTSLAGFRITMAVDPAIPGTGGSNALPNSATFAIHADTGERGRGRAGRCFWIGLDEDQVAANTVDVAAGGLIEDAMNALRTEIEALGTGYSMCVPHYVVNGVRPPSVLHSQIREWTISDYIIDSQKNRLPRHKRHKKQGTP